MSVIRRSERTELRLWDDFQYRWREVGIKNDEGKFVVYDVSVT